MHYSRFLAFSVGGGLLWVAGISMLGYALGNLPVIKSNFKLVSVMIIVVSVLPIVIEVIKHKLEAKKKADR
jgi:membrane-associated protein